MPTNRKLYGQNLSHNERLDLAQMTSHPGWKVFVKVMAEACRESTEEVIKLSPTSERFAEQVAALQMTARAMNKFSTEVLDSVQSHVSTAYHEANDAPVEKKQTGFRAYVPQPPKGEQQ